MTKQRKMRRYELKLLQAATRDFLSGLVAIGLVMRDLLKALGKNLWRGVRGIGREIVRPWMPAAGARRKAEIANADTNPQPARRRIRKRWKLAAAAISAGMLVVVGGLIANLRFANAVLPDADVDLWTINRPTSLTMLDRHGDVIGQRGIRYADPVPLEELPPYLIDAFLATEDRRFYSHRGYDARGLTRAMVANLKAGGVVEGGSTITQQLAKNLFLAPDRTLTRKLEELQFALWLEARLTKDEILSLYLNRTYLGGGAYGVEAAAQAFFSKSARDLTIAEAALLAGLPKAPSVLNPKANPAGAVARSVEVIDNLVETRRITREEAAAAKAMPPVFAFQEPAEAHGYFLDYVAQRIEERMGELHDDLIVRTTFDPELQAHAEAAVAAGIDEDARARGAEQAALVAFDNDGGIVAMAGGLDYADSQFNRATQAKRQPGSAFKPFVYLAAMEAGLRPESIVVDRPIRVGDWAPTNYKEDHRGAMRVSSAVALSVNSIAVQITESIGRERVIDAAKRAGLSGDLNPVASVALGAIEVPLIDLAAAYMPFAHSGAEKPPHAVLEISTRSGEVLYEYEAIPGFNVIDPGKADETARLLVGVMQYGTATRGQFGGHHLAGKTGTTNEWRDAWFIGFSRYYTAGVWVGNDDNRAMKQVSGSTIPLTIWKSFMEDAHEGLKPQPIVDDEELPQRNIRDVAGIYASLRSDLISTSNPFPDIDWDVIEGPVPQRRRGIFGFGREDPTPQRPETVVGAAAPGIEQEQ